MDEKILKRQARFGIVAPEDIDTKKKKRAERFGNSAPSTGAAAVAVSTGNDEQKRKRAERFGIAK